MSLISPVSTLDRLRTARILLCIAFVCGILISWKLWTTDHFFPITPVIRSLEKIPNWSSVFLICLVIALLVFTAFYHREKPIRLLFVLLIIVALIDQNRWQPWFYQYTLMVFILLFYDSKRPNEKNADAILNNFRLIICGIYFWSGMQKLNSDYFNDTAYWLMEPLEKYFPASFV